MRETDLNIRDASGLGKGSRRTMQHHLRPTTLVSHNFQIKPAGLPANPRAQRLGHRFDLGAPQAAGGLLRQMFFGNLGSKKGAGSAKDSR